MLENARVSTQHLLVPTSKTDSSQLVWLLEQQQPVLSHSAGGADSCRTADC
jgi:hypothetical protein